MVITFSMLIFLQTKRKKKGFVLSELSVKNFEHQFLLLMYQFLSKHYPQSLLTNKSISQTYDKLQTFLLNLEQNLDSLTSDNLFLSVIIKDSKTK